MTHRSQSHQDTSRLIKLIHPKYTIKIGKAPEDKTRRIRAKAAWRRTEEKERQVAGWRSWEEMRTAATI